MCFGRTAEKRQREYNTGKTSHTKPKKLLATKQKQKEVPQNSRTFMLRDQEMKNWDNVPMGHPWSQEKNDFARLLLPD